MNNNNNNNNNNFPEMWSSSKIAYTRSKKYKSLVSDNKLYLIGVHPFDRNKKKKINSIFELFKPNYVFLIDSNHTQKFNKLTVIPEQYNPIVLNYPAPKELYKFHKSRIINSSLTLPKPASKEFDEFIKRECELFSENKLKLTDAVLINEFNGNLSHKITHFFNELSDSSTSLIFADPLFIFGNYSSNLFTLIPFTTARIQICDFFD